MPALPPIEREARRVLGELGSAIRCVSSQHLRMSLDAVTPDRHHTYSVMFADPVSLRAAEGGPSGLTFDLRYLFTLTPAELPRGKREWHVAPRMYEYRLLDHHQTELLVYHRQPGPDFAGPNHPHLHVSASLTPRVDANMQREIELDKLHVVTGPVALASVVRMLITEFAVAPLRDDWRMVLGRAEETAGLA